jgi:hypothetical protein
MSNNHITVTELDPAKIKANLKEYFSKEESPYKDWNFESSALDLQLAVLAYNTHMNSILASTAFNESFIESAQLRKNLVSNARTLGYVPRSKRAATIDVKLRFFYKPDILSATENPKLFKGTQFTTKGESGGDLTFITAQDITGVDVSETGACEFPVQDASLAGTEYVRLYQGSFETKNFIADASIPNQRFKLNSTDIDSSTINAVVDGETYQLAASLADLGGDSAVYFIDESSEGSYEIYFGNGVLGKKITNLADIEVTYIVTEGELGNDLSVLEWASSIDSTTLDNSSELLQAPPQIILQAGLKSAGGASIESLDSIRFNAPKSFITQNRAVTIQDYKNVILKEFSGALSSANVWGGDRENEELSGMTTAEQIQYIDERIVGAAYITAIDTNLNPLPVNGQLEAEIKELLNDKRVFTVNTIFKPARRTDIILSLSYRYDPVRFTSSLPELTVVVRDRIKAYSAANLDGFEKTFSVSQFYAAVDSGVSDAVRTSYITNMSLRMSAAIPAVNSPRATAYTHLMPSCVCEIENFSLTPDELIQYLAIEEGYPKHLFQSSKFTNNNGDFIIRDLYNGTQNVRDLYLYKIVYDEVGQINYVQRVGSLATSSIGKLERLSDNSIQVTLYGLDTQAYVENVVISNQAADETNSDFATRGAITLDLQILTSDIGYDLNAYGSIRHDISSVTPEKL